MTDATDMQALESDSTRPDDFGATDEPLIDDVMVDPIMADPEPEPLPEPPPSDFAVEIDSIESVEVEADALWDDLG